MVAIKIQAVFVIIVTLFPFSQAGTDVPGDYAVVVRDTRIFAGLEPYAEILGKAEAGQFFPVESVVIDSYGISHAEVMLPDGSRTGFVSDVIIIREKESVLRRLLERVDIADIGLWDDEVLQSVQDRGVEIGFTTTQLLFAQGLPTQERERAGFEEWFFPRLVVLIEDDMVTGFTRIRLLPGDREIVIDLGPEDPEFSTVSGLWRTVEEPELTYLLASGGEGVCRFRTNLPVRGTYRLSARWRASGERSARISYRLLQGQEEIAVFKANQRLYDRRWVRLGEFETTSGSPVAIEISAGDGKPFSVETLRIEYVNKPIGPEDDVNVANDNITALRNQGG